MAKGRSSGSGLFGSAVGAWWLLVTSDVPVLAGAAAGLLGAAVTGIVALKSPGLAGSMDTLEFAMYAAGLLGYPAGVWCGVVACNRRRQAPGSIWLALLGTAAGVALSLAFWEAIGREFVAGTAEPFPALVWVGFLSVLSPVVLIPGLASPAYDYRAPVRWWRRRALPVPDTSRGRAPGGEEALALNEAGGEARKEESACPEGGLDNPPGSLFCGSCGAAL